MKFLITGFIILFNLAALAQSPGLTINVWMDSVKAGSTRYKIEMKICNPKKMTERGSWFTHDTSKINFASLMPADINCGEYFDNGMPELISGEEEDLPFNRFKFSNQVFALEKIFVFRISNQSSRGRWPEMYIVMPLRYKSFVTHIDISHIKFQPGKVIFLTKLNAAYEKSVLVIRQSLENAKGVELKNFALKELLEKD